MKKEPSILAILQDSTLAEALIEQFHHIGSFSITTLRPQIETEKAKTKIAYDVIITDIKNFTKSKTFQATDLESAEVPVICLLGEGLYPTNFSKSELGRYNYLKKPFKFFDLIKKLEEQVRLIKRRQSTGYKIGLFEFHPDKRLLFNSKNKTKVHLTDKETSILVHLYKAERKVIKRGTLLHSIWGYRANVTTHTLETHIYRLRQKIEDSPSQAKILVTDPGGYKLLP